MESRRKGQWEKRGKAKLVPEVGDRKRVEKQKNVEKELRIAIDGYGLFGERNDSCYVYVIPESSKQDNTTKSTYLPFSYDQQVAQESIRMMFLS